LTNTVFLSNPPNREEIEAYYHNLYTTDKKDGFVDQGTNEKLHKKIIDIIERYKTKGDLLDIGAGFGNFLLHLKKSKNNNFQLHAIEPDPIANRYIKRTSSEVNVQQGSFFDIDYPEEFFDIVTGIGSFEHIFEQSMLFEKAFTILKPKGILVFCVPNIEGFLKLTRFVPFFNVKFLAPQHFYDYNPVSIDHLANKYGFKVKLIEISPPIDITKGKPLVNLIKKISKILLQVCPQWCLFGGGLIVVFEKQIMPSGHRRRILL
jgi:SAM-dependent methyltransferase